jgi:hypothetical protein
VLTDDGLVSTKSHSNDENNTHTKIEHKETQVAILIKRKYMYINKSEVHLVTKGDNSS